MPLMEDLEPGPQQTLAGLARNAAHAAAASSSGASGAERPQAQRSRSSLTLRAPSRFLARNEILPGWQVELSEEEAYSHRDDEAGTVLLTLPVVLTFTPA